MMDGAYGLYGKPDGDISDKERQARYALCFIL